MKKEKYIIIPDVHGRTFWRDVVQKYKNSDVIFIFLGDYLDPYEYEFEDKVPGAEFKELEDIVNLKKELPNRVILLLGNHDLHYITNACKGSRWSYKDANRNKNFFNENLQYFNMTYSCVVNDKKFLFSHAGILPGWIFKNASYLNCEANLLNIEDLTVDSFKEWEYLPDFNYMLHTENEQCRKDLFSTLGDISYYRWGSSQFGSIVWADEREHESKENRIPGIIQIFGHSQQESDPVNYDNEAYCLDVRRAFILDEDGIIHELSGQPVLPKVRNNTKSDQKELEQLDKLALFIF